MINYEVNRLLHYAQQHGLMEERDKAYCANMVLDLLQLSEFKACDIKESLNVADDILTNMLNYAVEKNIIGDSISERDLFDTRIMNCVMPCPSLVEKKFWEFYQTSPKAATDYFYNFSIASNYIRKSRVDKDQKWKGKSKYGELDITINLSKPEKDPKEIARLKSVQSSSYPKCVICKENEGFAGNLKLAARQSIRLISLDMAQEKWFMQYSPYVYYQEHCIVLNAEHKPMQITHKTFANLLAFLDYFPHYFIGSNADLPIVGGSILSHDHYQGGCYTFPMENASIRKEYSLKQYPQLQVGQVNWPLTTIRLRAKKAEDAVKCASHIFDVWKEYSDESVGVYAYTNEQRHNTITPIARKKKGFYELDLVLRNNRTSDEYPLGIFHPHEDVHHIKKENIGLIEVMGLAVLPARLKEELQIIKSCLLKEKISDSEQAKIEKHQDWITYLRKIAKGVAKESMMELLQVEVAKKFERVLEDCGVFKLDEQGLKAFEKFIHALE